MGVSSAIGDSGLRVGEANLASGSPREDGISELQDDMAGVHLDQGKNTAFSEGDAAVRLAVLDEVVPNAEVSGVSAAEELVVDEASGSQEVVPGKDEDGGKTLGVSADEIFPPIAKVSTLLERDDASVLAENAVDLPDMRVKAEAWSTNEARASVPVKTGRGTWWYKLRNRLRQWGAGRCSC